MLRYTKSLKKAY